MRNELIPPLLGYYTMSGGGAAVAVPGIFWWGKRGRIGG